MRLLENRRIHRAMAMLAVTTTVGLHPSDAQAQARTTRVAAWPALSMVVAFGRSTACGRCAVSGDGGFLGRRRLVYLRQRR